MHIFDVASSQLALIAVGLILSVVVLSRTVRKHRSRRVDEPKKSLDARRAVRVLTSDEDLAAALSRAIVTEKQQGSRAAERVRHYRRLIPEARVPEGVAASTGTDQPV